MHEEEGDEAESLTGQSGKKRASRHRCQRGRCGREEVKLRWCLSYDGCFIGAVASTCSSRGAASDPMLRPRNPVAHCGKLAMHASRVRSGMITDVLAP